MPMQAYRGDGGRTPTRGSSPTRPAGLKRQAVSNPFKTSTLKEGGWAAPRPAASPPDKETRYPLHRRLGMPQGRSRWPQKIPSLPEILSPDLPTRSKSLYLMSCPDRISDQLSSPNMQCITLLFFTKMFLQGVNLLIIAETIFLLRNVSFKKKYTYTGLFEMIVGVLTTCHTQYT